MGYYSDFIICIEAGEDPTSDEAFLDLFLSVTGYTFDDLYGIKWYDFIPHMESISKAYPRTIFSVEYNGEDSDDMGIYFFHNGTHSGGPAEIIYPTFSHSDFTFADDYPELLL